MSSLLSLLRLPVCVNLIFTKVAKGKNSAHASFILHNSSGPCCIIVVVVLGGGGDAIAALPQS
jgi:hypothetical protein